jgi:carbamate kinase
MELMVAGYSNWYIGAEVDAACHFVEAAGKRAAIGAPNILAGKAAPR